jgi:hypothetical protein
MLRLWQQQGRLWQQLLLRLWQQLGRLWLQLLLAHCKPVAVTTVPVTRARRWVLLPRSQLLGAPVAHTLRCSDRGLCSLYRGSRKGWGTGRWKKWCTATLQ